MAATPGLAPQSEAAPAPLRPPRSAQPPTPRRGAAGRASASPSRRFDLLTLGALLAIATINAYLWQLSIPFHKGPDEGAHFQVVRFILDHGRLPAFHPDDLWLIKVPIGVVETYAAFPPLAYIVAAGASAPVPELAMWIARLVSVVSYVGTVGFAFLTARQLFPTDRQLPVVAALVVAFLPQFAFTGAYVNNDALAVLESAATVWLLARLHWEHPTARQLVALGALAGALVITKYTVYPVALVGVLAPLVSVVRRPRELARRGLLIASAGLVVSGWWFVRNWMLYRELIPGRVIADAKAAAGGNALFVPANHGMGFLTLSTDTDFWSVTLRSFFGVFGFMDIYMDAHLYWLALGLAALAGIGLIARLLRGAVRRELWLAAAVGAVLTVLTAFSTLAISVYGEYAPQGRYLFGALVPSAIALAAGWCLLGRLHPALRPLPIVVSVACLALNLVSVVGYVVPTYFGPQSETVIVQVDQPSTPRPRDTGIEIMGWSLVQGGDEWRPFAPDVISSYRQPVHGVTVYVDGPPGVGQYHGAARYGFRRLDVSHMYGGAQPIERVGFRLVLPPGSVSPGKHRVFACAALPTAEPPTCTNREFEVSDGA
jgi:4-amino-4-deoxy-L-arabinose transferase-like glycosyltransferase